MRPIVILIGASACLVYSALTLLVEQQNFYPFMENLLWLSPKVLFWWPGPTWGNSSKESRLNVNWVCTVGGMV